MGVAEEFRAIRQGYGAVGQTLTEVRLNWVEFTELTLSVLNAWLKSREQMAAVTDLPVQPAGRPFRLYGIQVVPDPTAPALFNQSHPRRYA